ncbi:hypothetical protein ENBRE01_1937 [Enteropsectra breve]|nr:hypothetical protein ENBRE01_1937 [Enteropsectra breve]
MKIWIFQMINRLLCFQSPDTIKRYERYLIGPLQINAVVHSSLKCGICYKRFNETEVIPAASVAFRMKFFLRILKCPESKCNAMFHSHCLINECLGLKELYLGEQQHALWKLYTDDEDSEIIRNGYLTRRCKKFVYCITGRHEINFDPNEYLAFALWSLCQGDTILESSDFLLMSSNAYVFRSLLSAVYSSTNLGMFLTKNEDLLDNEMYNMLLTAYYCKDGNKPVGFIQTLDGFLNKSWVNGEVPLNIFICACYAFLEKSKISISRLLDLFLLFTNMQDKRRYNYLIYMLHDVATSTEELTDYISGMEYRQYALFYRVLDAESNTYPNFPCLEEHFIIWHIKILSTVWISSNWKLNEKHRKKVQEIKYHISCKAAPNDNAGRKGNCAGNAYSADDTERLYNISSQEIIFKGFVIWLINVAKGNTVETDIMKAFVNMDIQYNFSTGIGDFFIYQIKILFESLKETYEDETHVPRDIFAVQRYIRNLYDKIPGSEAEQHKKAVLCLQNKWFVWDLVLARYVRGVRSKLKCKTQDLIYVILRNEQQSGIRKATYLFLKEYFDINDLNFANIVSVVYPAFCSSSNPFNIVNALNLVLRHVETNEMELEILHKVIGRELFNKVLENALECREFLNEINVFFVYQYISGECNTLMDALITAMEYGVGLYDVLPEEKKKGILISMLLRTDYHQRGMIIFAIEDELLLEQINENILMEMFKNIWLRYNISKAVNFWCRTKVPVVLLKHLDILLDALVIDS